MLLVISPRCSLYPVQAIPMVTTAEGQVVPTKQGLALHRAAGRAMSNAATPVFTSRCSRDHHMGHPSWPQSSLTKLCTLVSQNMQTLYYSCMTVSNDHVQHPSRLIRDLAGRLDLHATCLPRRHREGFWVGRGEELGRHMQQRA